MLIALLTAAVAVAYSDAAIEAYKKQQWHHTIRDSVISILYYGMSASKYLAYAPDYYGTAQMIA